MWIPNLSELNPSPNQELLPWLQVPNNLGDALRKVCRELSVKIISEQFEHFFQDEQTILNDSRGHVRTILLQGDNLPFCYCRTAVPANVYKRYEHEFNTLGMKLIGETMLYNNPKTMRFPFEFCHISSDHVLFELINNALPVRSRSFYARRSVFLMDGLDSILITEVFLNTLINPVI